MMYIEHSYFIEKGNCKLNKAYCIACVSVINTYSYARYENKNCHYDVPSHLRFSLLEEAATSAHEWYRRIAGTIIQTIPNPMPREKRSGSVDQWCIPAAHSGR